jgi:hypothetical protein
MVSELAQALSHPPLSSIHPSIHPQPLISHANFFFFVVFVLGW